MDELVKQVAKKTGLPEATAKTAVQTVISFLKKKLPAPIGAQIDVALSNPANVEKGMQAVGQLTKGLGSMMSKKGKKK